MARSKTNNQYHLPFYILSFLLAGSFTLTSPSSNAINLLHTATTFADYADDIRTGIEIEFTGLSLPQALELIHSHVGGNIVKKEKRIKTTVKEINENGMVYNEAVIPEWIIENSSLGELVIKVDNNQVDDDSILRPEDTVLELVTSPIRKKEVFKLQQILTALKNHGAKGTADGEAVSIQYNTEINEGKIATFDWQYLVNLMRVYLAPEHREQIDPSLKVPEFRRDYVALYSQGFLVRLLDKSYKPTDRELFDDFFYRQSLELLGIDGAWTMDIAKAQKVLLSQKNPIVPLVAKQNKLRISSLLAMAFPNDPITKLYVSSGWISPMPIVEWREPNNDFNVLQHYREVMGLMYMTKKFGAFNHDTLMSRLSGMEESTIRDLRDRSFKQINNNSSEPVIYRYIIGDPKTVNRDEYKDIVKAYDKNPVGYHPFYEYGMFPVSIPGESVVMHRNQFHRMNVTGKYNIGLINGFIMQALENKYTEMRFWNDYAKDGIPESYILEEIGVTSIPAQKSKATLAKIKQMEETFNQKFPKGWVLKGLFDLGTEKDIISDKTLLSKAVESYINSDFDAYREAVIKKYEDVKTAPEIALAEMKEHKGYKGWKIIQLLSRRNSVMIQQRFDLIREFRVEVVAGQVLGGKSTVDRYAYTYKKDGKIDPSYSQPTKNQIHTVEAFANYLIESLPAELRNMTFGLDIAINRGGKAVMIESNPGGNSNFLYEEEGPSIKELTKLLKKIPEMTKAGKLNYGLSPQSQMAYLKTKFAQWKIDTASLYPGMTFLENRIEDKEFKQIRTNEFEKTSFDKPSAFAAEGKDSSKKNGRKIFNSDNAKNDEAVRCEIIFH